MDARRRGTYFDFALVFPSPRPSAANHYTSRDIGTTVSGQKGPDDTKTLGQTSFTVGDYLVSFKGLFTLREETMLYQELGSLIAINNGLATL